MGNIGAGDVDPALGPSWSFRGQRLVQGFIQDLMTVHGMGADGSDHRLLFGGCSAGARGAMANLDLVPGYVPPNVRVVGFLDSCLWVDILPLNPATTAPLQAGARGTQPRSRAQRRAHGGASELCMRLRRCAQPRRRLRRCLRLPTQRGCWARRAASPIRGRTRGNVYSVSIACRCCRRARRAAAASAPATQLGGATAVLGGASGMLTLNPEPPGAIPSERVAV